jgi:uncharacterized protein (DUF302 family)
MTTTAQSFGMTRVLKMGFDEALKRIPEALKTEGFGVLTEIDVKDTMRKKLDVDFRRYRILGACNPPLAHQALSANLDVGLMLPCNVIVYEDDAGSTVVKAIDPMNTVAAQGDAALRAVAAAVRDKLGKVLERIE